MTKEEKTTRLFAMKAEGYTNKEIGEYYGVSEDAIKKTLQRSQKGTKRTLEEINDNPVKVEITMDTISPFLGQLLERIESLELEVASVKKLQVENAAIERLDDTEYKYFIQKGDEVLKFKEAIDACMYLKDNGYLAFYNPVDKGNFLIRQLTGKSKYEIRDLVITQSLKNDTTNMRDDLTSALNQNVELLTEFENFKKEA